MPITVCTWNINSVRLREPIVLDLLKQEQPDVLCLQECKSPVDLIPTENFAALGYAHMVARGQKGYNGVAILSKHPLTDTGHRDFCEKPNNRSRLDAALQTVCGQMPAIVFNTHTRTDAAQPKVAPRQSHRQQQAEVAAQPFVRKAMELFEGDPNRLRYEPPANES